MRIYPSLGRIFFLTYIFSKSLYANDYVIYSISQEISMGLKDEKLQKNFYINIGSNQGLRKGTKLNVYRKISKLDPINNENKYTHTIKMGILEVIHAEENSAIAFLSNTIKQDKHLVFDIAAPIIGDIVDVKVD